MAATVADIIKIMDTIAPLSLAETWDNAGLQIGRQDWPVRRIWVALDPIFEVVNAACQNDVDLLITHHPLIFQALKSIRFDTTLGSIIQLAVQHKLAIFAAHTNLDTVAGGMNDVVASRIGLGDIKVLTKTADAQLFKFVVYVPVEYEQKVLDAIFKTKAGRIGAYSCCTFRSGGKGTFLPDSTASPFTGRSGEISQADEFRVETIVRSEDLASVIELVRDHHPYETMAYDIYPLHALESGPTDSQGLGRIGSIGNPLRLEEFARYIKEKLDLKYIKVAGKPDLMVYKAAICAGSGSSLMSNFMKSDAQVFISGDLKYHDAREVEANDRGLIDIGHFASEHLMVKALADRLKQVLNTMQKDVDVLACGLEKDPFVLF